MTEVNPEFLEFRQDYGGGLVVDKRGLEASALVMRKYALAEDEVMAFSAWQSGRRAITVFHFNPAFPVELREAYMRGHAEGLELLEAQLVERRKRRERRLRAAAFGARRAGRALHALAAAAVLAVLHGSLR